MTWIHRPVRAVWRPIAAVALLLGLLAPVLNLADAAAQSTLPEVAAAAPESTVVFQSFDLDLEGTQWQQAEELLARLGIPDSLDIWRDEILAEGAQSGDFSESDLDALMGGEMALIVTPPAIDRLIAEMMSGEGHHGAMPATAGDSTPVAYAADQQFGFAAVLLPSDPAAAWDYAERQVNDYAQERDLELQVASGPGSDVIWTEPAPGAMSAPSSDDPMEEFFKHQGHEAFAIGHAGDYIIAAISPADVSSIMDVIDGTTPSLADSVDAQSVVARLPSESLAITYVNGQSIIDSLDPEILESLESFIPETMPREAWGGHAGIAVSAVDSGFRFDSISMYPEGTDTSAVLVPNDPAVSSKAEQAPAGTFFFEAGILPPNALAGAPFALAQAVNSTATGQEWGDEAMAMLPTPEQIEEQLTMATETIGFNPASDLFDLLGGEFIAFSGFPKIGVGGFGIDAVAAISTTDPVALAETTQKVAAWIDRAEPTAEVSVRRVGDDTVYVLRDPEMAEAPPIEFGVVGDQAVVAIGDGIASLQAQPEASLAQDSQFQMVMDLLPAEYSQVAYVDIGQAVGLASMLTGGFDVSAETADADLACAEYDNQEDAQAAFDADPDSNADLDLDSNGIACEDAFAGSGEAQTASQGSLENLRALAAVNFEDDGSAGTSAVLYIAE